MASTVLRLVFTSAAGKDKTLNFKNAKTTTSSVTVQALANGIIANGAPLWVDPPTAIQSAAYVITSEQPISWD